mgnify:CR=1 FL=1
MVEEEDLGIIAEALGVYLRIHVDKEQEAVDASVKLSTEIRAYACSRWAR